jgi:hypothetical protein
MSAENVTMKRKPHASRTAPIVQGSPESASERVTGSSRRPDRRSAASNTFSALSGASFFVRSVRAGRSSTTGVRRRRSARAALFSGRTANIQ